MSLTISQFVNQQIASQHLTVKEFAARSGLGLSHAYQLLRGERKRGVTSETMDAIARGLRMTPAEMAVLMGRGDDSANVPDELERIAIVRQISPEDWPAAKRMLLGLAAVNTHTDASVNPPSSRNNTRRRGQQPPLTVRHRALMLTKTVGTWAAIVSLFSRGYHPLSPPAAATA